MGLDESFEEKWKKSNDCLWVSGGWDCGSLTAQNREGNFWRQKERERDCERETLPIPQAIPFPFHVFTDVEKTDLPSYLCVNYEVLLV